MPTGVVDVLNSGAGGLPSGVYVASEAKGLAFVRDCWAGVVGAPFNVGKLAGVGVVGTPKSCPELPFEAGFGVIVGVLNAALPKEKVGCGTDGRGIVPAVGNRDFGCLILDGKSK